MTNAYLKLMAIQPARKPSTANAEAEAPVAEAAPSEAATEATPAEPATAEAAIQVAAESATQTPLEATAVAAAETANAQATAENKAEGVFAVTSEEDPSAGWTEEDDQLLMQMKAENKTWKEIGAALPGKKGPKDRFKTLSKGKGKEPAAANGKAKQPDGGKGIEAATGKGKESAGGSAKKYKHRHPHLATDLSSGDEDNDDAWKDEEEEKARMVIPVEEGSPLNIREV
jgi:hypothetical protein